MRRVVATTIVLLLAALGLAACGSDSSSSPPPVPSGAIFYGSINVGGDQWQAAMKLAQKVPAFSSLLQSALNQKTDLPQLASALGSKVAAVGVSSDTSTSGQDLVVGMSNPSDSKKLEDLLAKTDPKPVVRELDGWTVWGSTKSLDLLEQELKQGKLVDSDGYKQALKAEPDDGLMWAFVDGSAAGKALASLGSQSSGSLGILGSLQGLAGSTTTFKWLAGSGKATDNGLLFDGILEGGPAATANAGPILKALPADSALIADIDLSGLAKQLAGSSSSPIPGVDAKQLGELLGGELGLSVSGGAQPVLTVALQPKDIASATSLVQTLLTQLSALTGKAPEQLQVAGTTVTKVSLGSLGLYVGRLGDALLLTTSEAGFTDPRGAGGAAFDAAKKALGMPDKTAGFVYVDLKQLSQLAAAASSLGLKLPSQDAQALQGLSSLLFYAEPQKGQMHLKGILAAG
jgi:hypothetical protein